jgi:hypothetical protein
MNANLDKIAQDLYGKIQTRFSDIQMGDENAEVLSKKEDIPNARFFEFEYEEDGEALGTIAITLDAQDGVVIQVSGDLVDDKENTSHRGAFKFIRGFRQFAKDRLLNFDVQNIGKSNLDKRDYQFQSKRKEQQVMPQAQIMENKMYGNAKMSYQDLGENTRLVVKHTQPVNIELAAGRTMHIESIYIENAQGERFKYAQKHLNGARALAEHIKHGGTPYDAIGKHITGLSEELASLRKFKGYVSRQEQVSEAMGTVTGRVIDRIDQIKETIHKLQRAAYYETFVESFEEQDEQLIPEEIQNDLIDRLTVRTFNEELKSVFPYIYKFVDESQLDILELNADNILGEKAPPGEKAERMVKHIKAGYAKDGKLSDKERSIAYATAWKAHNKKDESLDPESQFESFMNDIVREDKDELLSPNPSARKAAIDKMNELLAQNTQVGANGDNGVNSLRGLIDDPEFIELVKNAPAETDLNDLIKGWVETSHEELLDQLVFPEGDEVAPVEPAAEEPAPVEPAPAPAPVEPAAEEPAPVEEPAPMAEDKDSDPPFDGPYTKSGSEKKDKFGNKIKEKNVAKHLAKQGMAKAIEKAKKAGATLETQLDFGSGVKTLAEILEDCGMSPQDAGYDIPSETGLPAILKYVAGFYNKMEGNFPLGGMRIKIKIKKAAEDGEFGDVSAEDLSKVLKFIDMKDPSGSVHQQEQDHVLKLAGVRQHDHSQVESQPKSGMNFDISNLESKLKEIGSTTAVTPSTNQTFSEETSLARIIDLVRR